MIKVKALSQDSAEILIYEQIGGDWFGNGITAKQFVDDLRALGGGILNISVRINSPGGEVFDGFAIYNALKNHGAHVAVTVDGLAASIASVIAMAGDQITMGTGAMMMIHNPWSVAIGDAGNMRKHADMLDQVKDGLVDAYATHSTLARAKIVELMDAETYFTADQAVEQGFATAKLAAEEPATAMSTAMVISGGFVPVKAIDHRAVFAQLRASLAKTVSPTPNPSAAVTPSAVAEPLEDDMSGTTPSASAADLDNASKTGAALALAADTARRADIRTRFGSFASAQRELLDACLDDVNCTADAASTKLLKKLGEGVEPLAHAETAVRITKDAREKFLDGAVKAVLTRLNLEKIDPANEFNGLGLPELAARSLQLAGISIRGLTRDGIARKVLATMTTSDFPQLLAATAGKVLRAAYDNFPNTWQYWAAAGQVSDFKIHPRIQTGSFNNMATILEGGEYTFGSLAEDYETAQAVTKGKAIMFTRQMLVNDDLGGFNRRAMLMGRAAARTVNVDAYAYLTSGSGTLGPTSTDTGQFFNATAVTTAGGHANYTGTGTAISVTSLGVGKKQMRLQKDKSLTETLNINPSVLVVPVGKEDFAKEIVTSATKDSQSNANQPNVLRNAFTVYSDPYLDAIATVGPIRWYLFAAPNDLAAFEVVFLDGNQTPFIDDMIDFDTDAMKFKVRLDYGIAIGDWRAGYCNAGA